MVTTGALLHGNQPRHLDFNDEEHPVALQLGGSDPSELAHAAKLGERWGYDEINLNCGCPSERVQTGSFGACLMADPALVAQCVQAMRDAVSIPVTVKHRVGLDRDDNYGFVRDFVGTVHAAGCDVFIVHARNAVLKGLTPKQNREVPPLRYAAVHQLKLDFADCAIVINGGIGDWRAIDRELALVDGVMLGRIAYHDPWTLQQADPSLFDAEPPVATRADALRAFMPYVERQLARGVPLRSMVRHILGLYLGQPGGRKFRQVLSDAQRLRGAGVALLDDALREVEPMFDEVA
jgi:tRNA-dihydrouridine synthase A